MGISSIKGSVEGLRRKLRAVAAMVEDPAATARENANAKPLKSVRSKGSKRRARPSEIGRTMSFGSADG